MPEVSPLSPELSRRVSVVARALVAAARSWSLYPVEHPAVRAAVERLGAALRDASAGGVFVFAVTPDTLLVDGLSASTREGAIAEAAAWLHQRDVLQLTFMPDVPASALHALLTLLAEDIDAVRA